MGWVARYTSPDTGANVQLVTHDATAPEDSAISVHTERSGLPVVEARDGTDRTVEPDQGTRRSAGAYRAARRARALHGRPQAFPITRKRALRPMIRPFGASTEMLLRSVPPVTRVRRVRPR